MLIIQYDHCIVTASLGTSYMTIISQPGSMMSRKMLRGFNEKVFFCERHSNAEKIFMLQPHSQTKHEVEKKEIWQLTGSHLVAFELEADRIENDLDAEIR